MLMRLRASVLSPHLLLLSDDRHHHHHRHRLNVKRARTRTATLMSSCPGVASSDPPKQRCLPYPTGPAWRYAAPGTSLGQDISGFEVEMWCEQHDRTTCALRFVQRQSVWHALTSGVCRCIASDQRRYRARSFTERNLEQQSCVSRLVGFPQRCLRWYLCLERHMRWLTANLRREHTTRPRNAI